MADESADDPLGDVRSFLVQKAEAAGPTRPKSLKDTISALMPELDKLKASGFTDAAIAAALNEKSIAISAGTLKNYMSAARATAPRKRVTAPASKGKANETPPSPPAAKPSELAGAGSRKTTEGRASGLGHKLNDDV